MTNLNSCFIFLFPTQVPLILAVKDMPREKDAPLQGYKCTIFPDWGWEIRRKKKKVL